MSAHARISPSALSRVIRCPGSVQATAKVARTSNSAAAEGTLLHEIAADCLEYGMEPGDFIGRTMTADGHTFTLGEASGQTNPYCLADALDWIREQPGRLFVEKRVRLDPWLPEQYGTLDVGLIDGDLATIFDWKMGYILVQTVENDQLRAYALGFLQFLRALGYRDPKRFRIIIEMPRAVGGARYYQPWEIRLEELMPFGDVMSGAMAAADAPNAPRHAGAKQCFYCEAKNLPGGCTEHSEWLLDMVSQKFEDIDDGLTLGADPHLPPPKAVTPERRSYIVRHAGTFQKWLAQLDAETLADAIAGRPTPGLKAVTGQRGDRKWADEVAAEALLVGALRDDAFNRKLKSVAESEKVLKPKRGKPGQPEAWDRLTKLITQDDGKPILVDEHDERPALKSGR